MRALRLVFFPVANRSLWSARAWMTRSQIADDASAGSLLERSRYWTGRLDMDIDPVEERSGELALLDEPAAFDPAADS